MESGRCSMDNKELRTLIERLFMTQAGSVPVSSECIYQCDHYLLAAPDILTEVCYALGMFEDELDR